MSRYDNLQPTPPVEGSLLPPTNVIPQPVALNAPTPWWSCVGVSRRFAHRSALGMAALPPCWQGRANEREPRRADRVCRGPDCRVAGATATWQAAALSIDPARGLATCHKTTQQGGGQRETGGRLRTAGPDHRRVHAVSPATPTAMTVSPISDSDIGTTIGPTDGYLAFLSMAVPPSVYEVPDWDEGRMCWKSGYFVLRGSDDCRDLVCLNPSSEGWLIAGHSIIQGVMPYRGDLTVVSVPRGSLWNVTTGGGATTAAAEPLAAKPPDDDHRQRHRGDLENLRGHSRPT
jgi:hypothetical protein